jgi:hypothetical protein
VDLKVESKLEITDELVLAIATNCPGMRQLQFSSASNVTDDGVTALAYGCPALLIVILGGNAQVTQMTDLSRAPPRVLRALWGADYLSKV